MIPLFSLLAAHPLVHLNAGLNLLATVLLVVGYWLIRRGRQEAHARTMLAAFWVSCLFLVSYLTYHAIAGSVTFTHPGAVRMVYLTILLTHVVLAMAVPWLAMATIFYGLRGTGAWGAGRFSKRDRQQFLARHRRLAHWTWPLPTSTSSMFLLVRSIPPTLASRATGSRW